LNRKFLVTRQEYSFLMLKLEIDECEQSKKLRNAK
jgi:hypothetical protein